MRDDPKQYVPPSPPVPFKTDADWHLVTSLIEWEYAVASEVDHTLGYDAPVGTPPPFPFLVHFLREGGGFGGSLTRYLEPIFVMPANALRLVEAAIIPQGDVILLSEEGMAHVQELINAAPAPTQALIDAFKKART